jgi:hypothetical protein
MIRNVTPRITIRAPCCYDPGADRLANQWYLLGMNVFLRYRLFAPPRAERCCKCKHMRAGRNTDDGAFGRGITAPSRPVRPNGSTQPAARWGFCVWNIATLDTITWLSVQKSTRSKRLHHYHFGRVPAARKQQQNQKPGPTLPDNMISSSSPSKKMGGKS